MSEQRRLIEAADHYKRIVQVGTQNRSAESVAREILEGSLLPESRLGFGDRLAALWDGADLSGIDFERDKTPYEPVDLE